MASRWSAGRTSRVDSGAAIGRRGEALAAWRLRRDGWRIVSRNRHVAGVEIDIVALDPRCSLWLLAEVKTSANGQPASRRVDRGKRLRLLRAARRLGIDRPVAIEVIAVDLRRRGEDRIRRIRLEAADLGPCPSGQRGW